MSVHSPHNDSPAAMADAILVPQLKHAAILRLQSLHFLDLSPVLDVQTVFSGKVSQILNLQVSASMTQ